jgi:hypothetical protein
VRLESVRNPVISYALLALMLAACNDGDGSERGPVNVIDLTGDAGMMGCSQPSFPSEQPDLSVLAPPRFITDAPNGQALVRPGMPIDAEIGVNGATKQVIVELRDAWSPDFLVYSDSFDTPGNETVSVTLLSQEGSLGRFYMKVTLCGFDCEEREVVFDINPDMNSPYERTLIEDGEVIRVDRTCIDFTADAGIGSGTVIIQ